MASLSLHALAMPSARVARQRTIRYARYSQYPRHELTRKATCQRVLRGLACMHVASKLLEIYYHEAVALACRPHRALELPWIRHPKSSGAPPVPEPWTEAPMTSIRHTPQARQSEYLPKPEARPEAVVQDVAERGDSVETPQATQEDLTSFMPKHAPFGPGIGCWVCVGTQYSVLKSYG